MQLLLSQGGLESTNCVTLHRRTIMRQLSGVKKYAPNNLDICYYVELHGEHPALAILNN